MTLRMPKPGVQIDRVHSAAICDEIGDSLRSFLGLEVDPMQPNLCALIRQLHDISSRNHEDLNA